MMRPASCLRRMACAAATAMLAALPAVAAPPATDFDIVRLEFGIFEDDGSDRLGFGATDEIPLIVGQAYGWLIQLKTGRKSLAVREEFLLPRPTNPAASPDNALTPPQSRDVLYGFNERRMPVADGNVFGVRKIVQGDAPGRYRLRVFIERRLVATFDYTLYTPPAAAGKPPPGKDASRPAPRSGLAAPTR